MKTSKTILSAIRDLNQIIWLFIFALVIPLFYSSCDEASIISQTNDLKAAKDLWEKTNIKEYRVEIERVCFCPAPIRYTMWVENGETVQIIDTQTGEKVENITGYLTIDELFTWLEGIALQDPQKLELEFHPQLGYPTFIDYNQSDMIADEEMLMNLKNLLTE